MTAFCIPTQNHFMASGWYVFNSLECTWIVCLLTKKVDFLALRNSMHQNILYSFATNMSNVLLSFNHNNNILTFLYIYLQSTLWLPTKATYLHFTTYMGIVHLLHIAILDKRRTMLLWVKELLSHFKKMKLCFCFG